MLITPINKASTRILRVQLIKLGKHHGKRSQRTKE